LSFVGDTFGPIAAQHYLEIAGNPRAADYDYSDILSHLLGDFGFLCPSLALARYSRLGTVP